MNTSYKIFKPLFLMVVLCMGSTAFAQPANDDPCSATVLSVSTSCSYSTYTNAGATASSGVPAPGCANYSGGDVWFTVTVPAGGELTFDTDTGVMTDGGMAVYSGSCGSLFLEGCNDDGSSNGLMPMINLTGQTPGATLWIRVWEYGNNNNGTFGICVTEPAPPPANDDCSGAISVTPNPDLNCGSVTSGTIASATASSQSNSCFGTADDDVWYSFTATNSTHYIDLLNVSGSTTDLYHSVYSGNCGSIGSPISCSDPNSSTLTGLTPGNTYYIRIYSWTSTSGQTTTFDLCIGTPPPPPANDDCSGATSASVNPDLNCGTTTAGTISSATASSQATGCSGTADDDVWYSFTATNSTHYIDLLNVSGSTTDLYHSVYSGNCGSIGSPISCSDPNSSTLTGLTPGNTYYIRIYSWTSTSGQTTTFDLCIGTPPPPPANDDCSGATSVTVNPDNLCGSVTSGTIASATTSSQTNDCFGTADDDVWYSFTATNSTHLIDLLNVNGSTTDLYHSVYSGTCGSIGSAISCSDPNSSTVSGLTPGNTYYVRIYSYTSLSGQDTDFDLCIGTPPPPPANDDCNGAQSVSVSSTGCSPTSGTIYSATASSQTNGCFGTANDDVWYSFTATSSAVQIDISNITGGTSDLYHSVYSGSCGSPGAALVCSDPNTSSVTGLTVGNTYYVRIFSYTSSAGQTSAFDLCIQEVGPCGNPQNQDYCDAPAVLTAGSGDFSANTSGTYSDDSPANLSSLFCGSIENNSWYEFVAGSTSETFDFTSVTGCSSGIQAEVYEVTQDASGCCTDFTSMSNCWNPTTATTGSVTATGLTPGNTYILMVDGYGGDICDFTVSGWTATGILPVTLTEFTGIGMPEENLVNWTTKSEIDNDYFNVLRSFDGVNFEKIGTVDGHGNSTATHHYQFSDRDVRTGKVYYRLEQVDFDGEFELSEIIAINREANKNGLIAVWPNPAKNKLFIEINPSANNSVETVELLDVRGQVVQQIRIDFNQYKLLEVNLSSLDAGMYIVKYTDKNGVSQTERFIKH